MAARTRESAASGLDALLASKEMILVCGSGGVGKTTVAAALALAAAVEQGGRVLVLTVDPARRLADALGVGRLGNDARRVPVRAFDAIGVHPRGELWAAMLDTKAGWDELITRHAPDERTRTAVLSNPLYQNITSRFVHSHDYLAMEQLHEVHATGVYDLVVVDTPPSRNALDILDAPSRMIDFFGSRLLRWLTVPYRSRLFTIASKPFYQVADRILGSRFLQDIAEFFILFQAMEGGFVARAEEVEALLGDPRTAFVVVTTLEAAPAHEAGFLAGELRRRGHSLGAMIANRVTPPALSSRAAARGAERLAAAVEDGGLVADVAAALAAAGAAPDVDVPEIDVPEVDVREVDVPEVDVREVDVEVVAAVLTQVAASFHDVALVATREAERRAELGALVSQVLDVPALPSDVHDLSGLLQIVAALGATE